MTTVDNAPMDWYPALRHLHLPLVGLSIALFALRGLGVLAGLAWPMRAGVRALTVAIDCLLLASGLGLALLLQLSQPWLWTKLALLIAYILLGSLALRRAPTRAAKAVCYLAALATVGFMVTVARAHHPLGVFA